MEITKSAGKFQEFGQGFEEIKEISSCEFLNQLYKDFEICQFGDKNKITIVNGVVKVHSEKFKNRQCILENFLFRESVIFHGESSEQPLDLGNWIVFINCKFEKKLSFKYCEALDSPFEDFTRGLEVIQLKGGYFNSVHFEDNDFPFGVLIEAFEGNIPKIQTLELINIKTNKGGVSLNEAEIINQCDLTGNTIEFNGIEFKNCLIKCKVRFSSNTSSSITFSGSNSVFEKDVLFWSDKVDSIIWNDGLFKSEIYITAVKVNKRFEIAGCIFEDLIFFIGSDDEKITKPFEAPQEIWLQDNKFQNGFRFNADRMNVNKLIIIFSEKSTGVLEFENSYFNNVSLLGNNFNNSLFFRDCFYENLTFSNFFNRALISFNNNVQANSNPAYKEFKIENSNLGNTEFYDFDFSKFAIIRIINSRIDNIYSFGVKWFEENQLQLDEKETSNLKILSQKREIYRQLKFAAEKQSDRITALSFKAREINTHKLYLIEKRGEQPKTVLQKLLRCLRTLRDLDFLSDSVSINLGKTNCHGQNWIYPLLWIFGITLAFYPLLMILADQDITFAWNLSPEGWNLFWKKFGSHSKAIPQLFNPARRLSDLFDNTDSTTLHILDGFHRIILAFFIFQIVSAFRKFVK